MWKFYASLKYQNRIPLTSYVISGTNDPSLPHCLPVSSYECTSVLAGKRRLHEDALCWWPLHYCKISLVWNTMHWNSSVRTTLYLSPVVSSTCIVRVMIVISFALKTDTCAQIKGAKYFLSETMLNLVWVRSTSEPVKLGKLNFE